MAFPQAVRQVSALVDANARILDASFQFGRVGGR